MRKITSFVLLAILALAWSGCQKPEEDPVIARINGTEIRKSQLQGAVQRRASFLRQQGQPMPPNLQQQALQMLIQNELLYQEGSMLDMPELEETVELRYREISARFPSEDAFRSSMQQMNASPENIRENIRREVIINNMVENKIAEDITISDKEVKSFYKENKEKLRKPENVRARQILISLPPAPTEEEERVAQDKVADIKKRLKKESFEELAMIYSDHPSSSQGGDLGILTRGRADPEFEEAVFSAKKGRVTGPVKTKSGLHLILVESREQSGIPPLKEIMEGLRERLKREKINQATAAFLEGVAARSQIEIVPQQPSW